MEYGTAISVLSLIFYVYFWLLTYLKAQVTVARASMDSSMNERNNISWKVQKYAVILKIVDWRCAD